MKVYGLYCNSDPTEGRGAMVLKQLFESRLDAERCRREQKDYPGWPMWKVEELDVEPASEQSQHTHELKTWPEFYQAISTNAKTVEIRKNDRPFMVGDILKLEEFDPSEQRYTGRSCERFVTHIVEGGQFGIERGYIAMSIAEEWEDPRIADWTPTGT